MALGNTMHAYAAVSTDGGATFGPDLRLSSVASEWIRPSAGEAAYEGVAARTGDATVRTRLTRVR